jgi:hypothetical protein
MKARKPKDWSDHELESLKLLAKRKVSPKEIAKTLGRPVASVRRMASGLNLILYKKPALGEDDE